MGGLAKGSNDKASKDLIETLAVIKPRPESKYIDETSKSEENPDDDVVVSIMNANETVQVTSDKEEAGLFHYQTFFGVANKRRT